MANVKLNLDNVLELESLSRPKLNFVDIYDNRLPTNQWILEQRPPPPNSLAQSIMDVGVIHPIGVNEVEGTDKELVWQLKWGKGRLYAIRRAFAWILEELQSLHHDLEGEEVDKICNELLRQIEVAEAKKKDVSRIPVHVYKDVGIVADVSMFFENEEREFSWLNELYTVKNIIKQAGIKNGMLDDLSKALNKPKNYVRKLLATRGQIDDEVLNIALQGEISKTTAEAVAKQPPNKQKELLKLHKARMKEDDKGITAKDVDEVRRMRAGAQVAQAQTLIGDFSFADKPKGKGVDQAKLEVELMRIANLNSNITTPEVNLFREAIETLLLKIRNGNL